MLDPQQLIWFVIGPVLDWMDMDSPAARALLIGTALTESGLRSISEGHDRVLGPGIGIYQMERATHDDIWDTYIDRMNGDMTQKVQWLLPLNYQSNRDQIHIRLADNLAYATAMCRLHYRRVKEPLPDYTDLKGLGRYWKKYYNTASGAGKPEDFVQRAALLPTLELM